MYKKSIVTPPQMLTEAASKPKENGYKKPFNKGYTLRLTAKHVLISIDISIRKTFERVQEFDGDIEKSKEIFKTLSMLHTLRNTMEDFKVTYKEEFADQ